MHIISLALSVFLGLWAWTRWQEWHFARLERREMALLYPQPKPETAPASDDSFGLGLFVVFAIVVALIMIVAVVGPR